MITSFILWAAALGGMAATLAWIVGLLVRARGLSADREFAALRRPGDLADFPFVTIIVPVRNEEHNIVPCLESLLALDYPRFEILVADDHSTDRTPGIVREFIGRRSSRPEIRFVPTADDPTGGGVEWACGKSRTLWHAAQQALGEWILFVDADTRQKPDTLWRALALARGHTLRALSMSGVTVNRGFWGEILETLVYPAIFLVIPWRRVNDPDAPKAWMNGQFILYEREAYLAVEGHLAIAADVSDDLGLAYHSKAIHVRFLFLPVSAAYEGWDYKGLKEAFRGWTRRMAVGGAHFHLKRRVYAVGAVALFVVAVLPVMGVLAGLWGTFGGRMIFGVSFTAWALASGRGRCPSSLRR